jgi:hypothetical protein
MRLEDARLKKTKNAFNEPINKINRLAPFKLIAK